MSSARLKSIALWTFVLGASFALAGPPVLLSNPGVSSSAQTFSGLKTFADGIAVTSGGVTVNGSTGLSLTAVASGSNAISVPQGSRVYLGAANRYIEHGGDAASYTTIRGAIRMPDVNIVIDGSGINTGGLLKGPSNGAMEVRGTMSDGSSAVGVILGAQNNLTTAGAKLLSVRNNTSTEKLAVDKDGRLIMDTTDNSGTPGNTTINKTSASAAIAASASAVTITNSLVTAASVVACSISGSADDATLTSIRHRVAAGSIVVTGNAAATAAVRVNCAILAN